MSCHFQRLQREQKQLGFSFFFSLSFSLEIWVKGRVISFGITQAERTLHLSQTMNGSSVACYNR